VLVSDSALCEERSGKALSDCLAVNFAMGCTHGRLFCYVDRIHKMSQRVPLRLGGAPTSTRSRG